MNNTKQAAVFILLGQSNAVGHAVPMKEEDRICSPMKNVFGLHRDTNQKFDITKLQWRGYTSSGMNLAEEQDHTYSVANCLAQLWQDEIDSGNPCSLPDLYIIQIAIGAQGVTDKYMWYPDRPRKLVPGKLGTVDISLAPFTEHVLSLVRESLAEKGLTPRFLLHWRGGEEDTTVKEEILKTGLKSVYERLFGAFYQALGEKTDTVIHLFPYVERCLEMDPEGNSLKSMHYINSVFETLASENENVSLFDVRRAPHYVPDTRKHGLFLEDAVHYTPQTNQWVAEEIRRSWF